MKILQVNKLYSPHIGGIERVIQDIAEGLSDRYDIKVLVCQPKGKAIDEIINSVSVRRSSSIGTFFSMPVSFQFLCDFRRLSRSADLVHIHMPFPLADIACLLSGYKGKVVVSWHSDIVKQKKMMTLYKPFMTALLKRADCILVATPGHITGSAYLGPYKEKCRVIPYGIDIEAYEKAEAYDILTQKLTDPDSKKILFTGRLVYYKGVDVLLKAFCQTTDCELFIAGDGILRQDLENEAKADNIEDRVHFLGRLSDSDLKAALRDCDIFVLPSVENSEAFGIVQMEAMVYSKPVINTSLPTGVPYVSLDGESAITVPPKDEKALAGAINTLVHDDQMRQQYGQEALRCVREKYDMKKVMDSISKMYEEITGQEVQG
ncbi:MAG: glycosyltransferase [Oscillospiraceae bacterium]|nr:glycosyltransferase [Oscillospiraceae bacterium]